MAASTLATVPAAQVISGGKDYCVTFRIIILSCNKRISRFTPTFVALVGATLRELIARSGFWITSRKQRGQKQSLPPFALNEIGGN